MSFLLATYTYPPFVNKTRADRALELTESYLAPLTGKLGFRSLRVVNASQAILEAKTVSPSHSKSLTWLIVATYLTVLPLLAALTVKIALSCLDRRKIIDYTRVIQAENSITAPDRACIEASLPELLKGKNTTTIAWDSKDSISRGSIEGDTFHFVNPTPQQGLIYQQYETRYRLFEDAGLAQRYQQKLIDWNTKIEELGLSCIERQRINLQTIEHEGKSYVLCKLECFWPYDPVIIDYTRRDVDTESAMLDKPIAELTRLLMALPLPLSKNDLAINPYGRNGDPRIVTIQEVAFLRRAQKEEPTLYASSDPLEANIRQYAAIVDRCTSYAAVLGSPCEKTVIGLSNLLKPRHQAIVAKSTIGQQAYVSTVLNPRLEAIS